MSESVFMVFEFLFCSVLFAVRCQHAMCAVARQKTRHSRVCYAAPLLAPAPQSGCPPAGEMLSLSDR